MNPNAEQARHRADSAQHTALSHSAHTLHARVVIFIGMQKQQIENNNLLF